MDDRKQLFNGGFVVGLAFGTFIALFCLIGMATVIRSDMRHVLGFLGLGAVVLLALILVTSTLCWALVRLSRNVPVAGATTELSREARTDHSINLAASCECCGLPAQLPAAQLAPEAEQPDRSHYNEYLRAFRKLMVLEANGLDDSEEAQQLRTVADFHWMRMTPSERYAAELVKPDLWKLPEE